MYTADYSSYIPVSATYLTNSGTVSFGLPDWLVMFLLQRLSCLRGGRHHALELCK
jgi:hypothetical protein